MIKIEVNQSDDVNSKILDMGVLEELFVSDKTARTIEFFILHEKWIQNKKELMEILDIYPEAMKEILERLVKLDIIEVDKKIASSKFYKVNKKSNLIIPLRTLIHNLSLNRALLMIDENKNVIKEKELESNIRSYVNQDDE
ncbi:MAG: hypothetical protein JXA99_04440 [Candidatus Lokiarchaeota archaeon]|nr:hypothetical protein [Candidatus Lokiarchaeota archaeon]